MAEDANALIAQGIKPPPPVDFVGPLSAISQIVSAQANAEHARASAGLANAQTGQVQQGTSIAAAQYAVKQEFNRRVAAGEDPTSAMATSGYLGMMPVEGDAALKNYQLQRDLNAIKGGNPRDPNSYAAGGPAMVGQAATALKTQADTAQTQFETKQKAMVAWGSVGNAFLSAGDSPVGQSMVLSMAKGLAADPNSGITPQQVEQFSRLPPDQQRLAAQHLVASGQSAKDAAETSGRAKLAQDAAGVSMAVKPLQPGEHLEMGPGAQDVVQGRRDALGNPIGAGAAAPAAMPGTPPVAAPGKRSTFTNPTLPIFTKTFGGDPTDAQLAAGFSPQGAARLVSIESRGNPNAVAPSGKFVGLVQAGTPWWNTYGEGSPFDPAASLKALSKAGPAYAKALEPILGRQPTDAELYVVHQQGLKGGPALFANPNARAGDIVGDAAIRGNGGNPNGTAKQFTDMWTAKFNGTTPATSIAPFGGRTLQMPGTAPGVAPAPNPDARKLDFASQGGLGALPAPPIAPPAKPLPAPLLDVGSASAATPAPVASVATPAAASAAGAPATTPPSNIGSGAYPDGSPIPTIANPTGAETPKTGLAADKAGPLLLGSSPGMTVAEKGSQEVSGKNYGELPEIYRKQAETANDQSAIIDSMKSTMDTWEPGAWAKFKQGLAEQAQALFKTIGMPNDKLDKVVGDYQQMMKFTGNFVREETEKASQRGGAQAMKIITGQLMSPDMDRYGLKGIFTQLQGDMDYDKARFQAQGEWARQHGDYLGPTSKTGNTSFPAYWAKNASPYAFILARMERDNPEQFRDVISGLGKTPEGKKELGQIFKQMMWAHQNELVP